MYTVELFDIVMGCIVVALLLAFVGTLVHSVMKSRSSGILDGLTFWAEEWSKTVKKLELTKAAYDYDIDCMSRQHARDILKAKREHGKKVRKAADRKLERTERDYEARIEKLKEHIEEYKRLHRLELANAGSARSELSAFQSIVSQELENFMRLASVRNACIKAINANHKAWQAL